jgi:hypothetical protein
MAGGECRRKRDAAALALLNLLPFCGTGWARRPAEFQHKDARMSGSEKDQ